MCCVIHIVYTFQTNTKKAYRTQTYIQTHTWTPLLLCEGHFKESKHIKQRFFSIRISFWYTIHMNDTNKRIVSHILRMTRKIWSTRWVFNDCRLRWWSFFFSIRNKNRMWIENIGQNNIGSWLWKRKRKQHQKFDKYSPWIKLIWILCFIDLCHAYKWKMHDDSTYNFHYFAVYTVK